MITTLSPSADLASANVGAVGAPSIVAAMSDADDWSYASHTNAGASYTLQDLFDTAVAANQRIRAARPVVRYATSNGAPTTYVDLENVAGTQLTNGPWTENYNLGGPYTRYGNWFTLDWAGVEWTQADINAMRLRIRDTNATAYRPFVSKAWVEIEVLTQPDLVITGPSGALTTRRPTVTWAPILPDNEYGFGQKKYEVRVYTAAEYGAGGFNPSTTAVTVNTSGQVTSTATGYQVSSAMTDGTYRIYVRVATDFNGADWWSGWQYVGVTVSDTPIAPVMVAPAAGATVTTDVPTLTAFLQQGSLNARVRAEFQLATDSAFTTNLRTVTQPTSSLQAGGNTSIAVPSSAQLFQTTWYVRARQIDEYGTPGPYSNPSTFLVSHQPSATPVDPIGGKSVVFNSGTGNPVLWTFSDPSSVDTQTAYQAILERNDTGANLGDTGKIASSAQTMNMLVGASTSLKDVLLRWKVRVWDSDDVVGPYSAYALFTARDVPTVTITSPTAAQVIANPQPTVTWTFGDTAGRTQTNYRVTFQRTATGIVYDSGWIASNATSYTPPTTALTAPISDYSVTVYVQDSAGLQNSATVAFTTAWTAPAAPTATVDITTYDPSGYVKITWTNGSKDGTWVAWRVYRRVNGTTAWTLLYEIAVDQANYEYDDWLAGSGVTYDYAVVQVATRFSQKVESTYGANTVIPSSGNYWLVDPVTNASSIRLRHVRSDTYTDEYEQEDMQLIGRGRKIDYGTRWGYTGTLSAQIYDETVPSTVTARQQKQSLEALRKQQRTLYLRNPFGDVWMIASGNIQVDRVAGVGSREFVTVTLPYSEVS